MLVKIRLRWRDFSAEYGSPGLVILGYLDPMSTFWRTCPRHSCGLFWGRDLVIWMSDY